jgi:hypothetical protein
MEGHKFALRIPTTGGAQITMASCESGGIEGLSGSPALRRPPSSTPFDDFSTVIAIGSLAGNVSRNASSSSLSRWTASLRLSPGRLFLFRKDAPECSNRRTGAHRRRRKVLRGRSATLWRLHRPVASGDLAWMARGASFLPVSSTR